MNAEITMKIREMINAILTRPPSWMIPFRYCNILECYLGGKGNLILRLAIMALTFKIEVVFNMANKKNQDGFVSNEEKSPWRICKNIVFAAVHIVGINLAIFLDEKFRLQ